MTSYKILSSPSSHVVQREVQHPVPGEDQHHALTHAGANWLEGGLAQKSPGLLVDTKLTTSQWALEAKKVNGILGCIWRSVASRSRALLSTGGTHVEYCVQLCAPQCKRDTDILERAQRRASKITDWSNSHMRKG